MRIGASTCLALVAASLAVVGLTTPLASALPTTPTAASRPAPVHDLAGYDTGHGVQVSWTNPSTPFAGVVVRYSPGRHAPDTPSDGTAVPLRTAKASTARLSGLAAGAAYSVAVWTRDTALHYSRRTRIAFTTLPTPEATATISGTVTDSSHHALANVQVFTEGLAGNRHVETVTDGAGQYTISVAAGGQYVGFDGALATGGNSDRTGYIGDVATVHALQPGETRAGVDAELRPGAAITGRVSDAAGHPLAGVLPTAQPMSPYVSTTTSSFDFFSFFGPTATNPSAPNGRFVIKGLPAGVLQICVDPTRGPVTGGHESGYAGRCVSRAAIARIGRSTDVADIALAASPSGVIAGVVRDPSGALVRNAAVFADRVGAQSFDDFGVTYTGQDGSYRLAVSRGRYRVCVDSESSDFGDSAYGGAPTCVGHIVRVAAGRTTTVNVRLAAAGAIAGRAIGPDGHALADVSVLVRPVGRRRDENYAQVQTDSRGFYTAKGLAPGTYVSCGYPSFDQPAKFPTGLAPSCTSRDTAAVAVAGLTQLGLDPKLPIGGAVRGRVTDDLGAPIANALVIVESPRTGDVAIVGTNPDGTYTATGLSGGRYDMCAIRVTPSGTGGIAFFGFGSMCDTPPVSVPVGQFIDVDLQIPTGGSVEASVRDERGRPIGAVDVAALRQCDPRGDDYCTRIALFGRHRWVTVAASEMTDADGTAALTGLEPGAYAICYFAYYGTTASGQSPTGYVDGCPGTGFDVDVADHQSTHVDGELGAAGAVTGIVTDSTGKPLSGVQVTVSNAGTSDYFDPSEYDFGFGAGGPAADAVTDGTGRFFVHGVQPGKQTVCANAEGAAGGTSTTGYLNACVGGATAQTASPVSVTARRSAAVRLALQSGVAISGAATNTAGRRVNALVIVFAGPHRPVAITQTLAGGRYRVSALPAGSYSVCFLGFRYKSQCFDGVPWSGRVRVPAAAARLVLKPGAERKHVDAVLHR